MRGRGGREGEGGRGGGRREDVKEEERVREESHMHEEEDTCVICMRRRIHVSWEEERVGGGKEIKESWAKSHVYVCVGVCVCVCVLVGRKRGETARGYMCHMYEEEDTCVICMRRRIHVSYV